MGQLFKITNKIKRKYNERQGADYFVMKSAFKSYRCFSVKHLSEILSQHLFDSVSLKLFKKGQEYTPDISHPLHGPSKIMYSKEFLWNSENMIQYLNKTNLSVKIFQVQNYYKNLLPIWEWFRHQFEANVSINSYYTPPKSECFKVHADPYDLFVIQTQGRKTWFIVDENTRAEEEFILEPGDVLFIKSGVFHRAVTKEEESLHLTVGMVPLKNDQIINQVTNFNEALSSAVEKLSAIIEQDGKILQSKFLNLGAKNLKLLTVKKPNKNLMKDNKTKFNFIDLPFNVHKAKDGLILFCAGHELLFPNEGELLKRVTSRKPFQIKDLAKKFSDYDVKDFESITMDLYMKGLLETTHA